MDQLETALKTIRAGKWEEGLKALTALTGDPRQGPVALGHRAWLLRSMGRHEEAIADYERLVAESPENLDVLALLAETRLLAGDLARAGAEAVHVLQRNALNPRAAQVVVRCQQALGIAPAEGGPERVERAAGASYPEVLNPVVAALEQASGEHSAPVSPETGRLLYWLVRCIQPRLAIETGSFIGFSALCIGQGLEDNKLGHLHAFDLFLTQPDYVSPVLGKCGDTLAAARGHAERAGLTQRITFHKGDSSAGILSALAGREARVDFAFIDGDHRIRGCLKDWAAVDALLAEGGFVLLHDTSPERSCWLGPNYLLEQLGVQGRDHYHWVNLAAGAGLALIQKRTAAAPFHCRPTLGEMLAEWLFNRRFEWRKRKS